VAGAAAAAALLDGFEDRSTPPPADPAGAELAAAFAVAERAEADLAPRLRQSCWASALAAAIAASVAGTARLAAALVDAKNLI
jgi:hypothetical protein